MRILASSINFYPDHSGIALYSTDMPVYLAEHGHKVTMVTGFPYYPNWRKRPQDCGKLIQSEEYMGVRVLRGYLYVPRTISTFNRILHELSFVFFAFFNFFRAGRQECIVIISPPLLLGLVGIVFKHLWRAQLVVHLQDLQPDAALSLNMMKWSPLIRLLKRLESRIYRHASWIVPITDSMKENLKQKGVPEEKQSVHYNWIDVTAVSKLDDHLQRGKFLGEHPHAQGKFTVVYAGNIGVKQGLEVLVQLAQASQTYKDIHYFIIGEGAMHSQLEKSAKDKGLNNITFLPFMSQERYFEMLKDIDVSFVSQRPASGDVFFPSKLLGIMVMGKPLLISADPESELSTVVSNAGCGLVSAPDTPDLLLRNLLSLYKDRTLCRTLGQNGRQHVKAYDRERVLSNFMRRILEENECVRACN